MVEEGREGWKGRKGAWEAGRGLLFPYTDETKRKPEYRKVSERVECQLTESQSGEDGGTPESSPLTELRGDMEGGVMGGLWEYPVVLANISFSCLFSSVSLLMVASR